MSVQEIWDQVNADADQHQASAIERCAMIFDRAAESLRLDEKRYSRAGYIALVDAAAAIRATSLLLTKETV